MIPDLIIFDDVQLGPNSVNLNDTTTRRPTPVPRGSGIVESTNAHHFDPFGFGLDQAPITTGSGSRPFGSGGGGGGNIGFQDGVRKLERGAEGGGGGGRAAMGTARYDGTTNLMMFDEDLLSGSVSSSPAKTRRQSGLNGIGRGGSGGGMQLLPVQVNPLQNVLTRHHLNAISNSEALKQSFHFQELEQLHQQQQPHTPQPHDDNASVARSQPSFATPSKGQGTSPAGMVGAMATTIDPTLVSGGNNNQVDNRNSPKVPMWYHHSKKPNTHGSIIITNNNNNPEREGGSNKELPSRKFIKVSENGIVMPDQHLVPRAYQEQLFEKAKSENIIAVMDTGSGKTMVALMLIQEMVQLERQTAANFGTPKRLSFFIVNSVPLVFQQSMFIRANFHTEVRRYCGEMNVDYTSKAIWDEIIANVEVVVMTAQILLNGLSHGMIKLEQISLLVMDECHHAVKHHSYKDIMSNFYLRTPKHKRPKIFGMTASPITGVAMKSSNPALELEETMDARMFTADFNDLKEFVHRPAPHIIQYNSPPKYEMTEFCKSLRDVCGASDRFTNRFSSISFVLETLGPWCADRMWKFMLDIMANKADITGTTTRFENLGVEYYHDAKLSQYEETALEHAQMVSRDYRVEIPKVTLAYMSPKVIKLVECIRALYEIMKEDFCGIIFVDRRATAQILALLIQELPELIDKMKVAVLSGHGNSKEVDYRMNFREQNRVIREFKRKTFNLIIATSVAEEGLDIQPCNVVIRFDPSTSLISFIQSRGRARMRDSRYVILQEALNQKEGETLERILETEEKMREWISSLSKDRLMKPPESSKVLEDGDTADNQDECYYTVQSTGATVSLESALPLINLTVSNYNRDHLYANDVTKFDVQVCGLTGFVCTLSLPPGLYGLEIESDVHLTKNAAKRSAAFKACEVLHRTGILDDHLLLIRSPVAKPIQEKKIRELGESAKENYPQASPTFWDPPKDLLLDARREFYATSIRFHSSLEDLAAVELGLYRDVYLLTSKPLPDEIKEFAIHLARDVHKVSFETTSTRVRFSDEKVNLLHRFTLYILNMVGKKELSCDLDSIPFLLAPMRTFSNVPSPELGLVGHGPRPVALPGKVQNHVHLVDTLIAWHDVDICINRGCPNGSGQNGGTAEDVKPVPMDLPDDDLMDTILQRAKDPSLMYGVIKIRKDLNLNSVVPPELLKLFGTGGVNKLDTNNGEPIRFADAMNVSKTTRRLDGKPEGPILIIKRFATFKNCLYLPTAVEKDEKRAVLVPWVARDCKMFALKGSIYRMMALIPSIVVRLESYLLAFELRRGLKLEKIFLDLMLEALMVPSTNMAFNYERLETLGDSFLKLSTTIRLYIMNPSNNEGDMHIRRIKIISNEALKQHAKRLELFKYASSLPFSPKNWHPTRFTLEGKPWQADQQHELSNKTLADIVEATLGAAYLSGGLELALFAAKQLGIPFPEFENWKSFWSVYQKTLKDSPQYLYLNDSNTLSDSNSNSKNNAGGSDNGLDSSTTPRPVYFPHPREGNFQPAEDMLNYKFKNPNVFVEAMTHASSIRPDTFCYQRLEFLGDALLDFFVVRYYFQKFPSAKPGDLADIKDASVNNAILGAICLRTGLNRFMNQSSSTLAHAVSRTVQALEEKIEKAKREGLAKMYQQQQQQQQMGSNNYSNMVQLPALPPPEDPSRMTLLDEIQWLEGEYWTDIEMPKVLGDLVESTLGAVFVDCQFDFEIVSGLFERIIRPFLDRYVEKSKVLVHPTKELLEFLQEYGCDAIEHSSNEIMPGMESNDDDGVGGRSGSGGSGISSRGNSAMTRQMMEQQYQVRPTMMDHHRSLSFYEDDYSSWKHGQRNQHLANAIHHLYGSGGGNYNGPVDEFGQPLCLQEFTIRIHGQVVAKTRNLTVKKGRKEASQMALDLIKRDDPKFLERVCNCSKPKRRQAAIKAAEEEAEQLRRITMRQVKLM